MTYHFDLTDTKFVDEMVDSIESDDFDTVAQVVFNYYVGKYNLPTEDLSGIESDPWAMQAYTAGFVMDESDLVRYNYA